jgi:cytochrome P450
MTSNLLINNTLKFQKPSPLKDLLQAVANPLNFFNQAREYGEIFPTRLGLTPILILNHPKYIEEVFCQQNRVFMRKGHFLHNNSKLLLGNGLFLSEGKFYSQQRQLVQPAFHKQMINTYAKVMVEQTQYFITSWQDGQKRDVYQDFVDITMSIISKTMLGNQLNAQAAKKATAALDATMNRLVKRRNALFLVPNWLPTPSHWQYRQAVKQLDQVIYEIIHQHCQSEEKQGTFFDLLIYAHQEESKITLQQLRDEIINIFLAGHETTAIALTWVSFLLSQHPLVEAKLIAELKTVLNGRTPTIADLPQLRYTEAIALETLRLYPPVWLSERVALENTEIAGYKVKKGTWIIASQWSVHRHPDFFPDPEKFNPSRWENGLIKRLPLGTYFPFSLGARTCVGKDFGMMELVLLIATIFQNFQLKPIPESQGEILPSLTLRPKHGMKMLITKR